MLIFRSSWNCAEKTRLNVSSCETFARTIVSSRSISPASPTTRSTNSPAGRRTSSSPELAPHAFSQLHFPSSWSERTSGLCEKTICTMKGSRRGIPSAERARPFWGEVLARAMRLQGTDRSTPNTPWPPARRTKK